MDLVQWLVPGGATTTGSTTGSTTTTSSLPAKTAISVCLAPAWSDRLPAAEGRPALRRRSAPLVSRHLQRPLAVAVGLTHEDDDDETQLPLTPGSVTLRLSVNAEGSPLVAATDDDLRFSAVLGEYIGVVVDLCEAASLPVMGALPVDERRALDIVLGSLRGQTRSRLADALILVSAAAELAAFARGFSTHLSLRSTNADGQTSKVVPVDGVIETEL